MKGPLIVPPRAHLMSIIFDVVPRTREPTLILAGGPYSIRCNLE